MSNYSKIVDYAAKDALNTGDPLKLIKGTEIGAEYDAIATAIATKANSASPTFTGVSGFAVGAVGAPSIYMTGYATTGWYNIGANNLGFAVSGAKVLDIASTGLSVTGLLTPTISGTGVYFSGGDSTVSRRLEFSTTTTTNTGDTQKINALGATGVLVLQANSSNIATVSSTGLAVTGTLSASWVFSLTGGSVNPIVVSGATTGESYGKFTNTSGQTVFGVNNSVAGTLYSGGTAYASFFGSNVAKNVDLIVNGATVASLSSAGLAVTGDVSVSTKTPASAAAAGVAGTITWDANYLYVCTATNTWKRVAIATW